MRPHLPAALLGVLVLSVTSLTLVPECTHPPQRLTLIWKMRCQRTMPNLQVLLVVLTWRCLLSTSLCSLTTESWWACAKSCWMRVRSPLNTLLRTCATCARKLGTRALLDEGSVSLRWLRFSFERGIPRHHVLWYCSGRWYPTEQSCTGTNAGKRTRRRSTTRALSIAQIL